MVDALARWLILSWGGKRAVVLLLAGALSALAMPPFSFAPILFLTLPILAWTLEGVASEPLKGRIWSGFWLGAVFGFGFHLAGLYWVGHAILVEAESFWWAMPLAIIGLPMLMALFVGLGTSFASLIWPSNSLRIFALAGGLAASDMARGYALTGFPWNSFGYAVMASDELLQLASQVGLYGLSFLVVLVALLPAVIWPREDGAERLKPFLAVLLILIFAGWAGFGHQRLANAELEYEEGVVIRLVQPNILQTEKWLPEKRTDIIRTYLDLTDRASSPEISGASDVTHIIWPESAMPFFLLEAGPILAQLSALLPEGTHLLAGNIRRQEGRFYNSLIVFDSGANPVSLYDKQHLVPFGEYLPFADVLSSIGLEQISQIKLGFDRGTGPEVIDVPGLGAVRPLICYEAIFPHLSATKGLRPKVMINITNDGWFSESAGPYQHFAQSRMRATEQGISLARAANTGISAMIDPYGRIVNMLELGRSGIIDSPLPKTLPVTTFARFHHGAAFAMIILSFSLCVGAVGGRSRKTF